MHFLLLSSPPLLCSLNVSGYPKSFFPILCISNEAPSPPALFPLPSMLRADGDMGQQWAKIWMWRHVGLHQYTTFHDGFHGMGEASREFKEGARPWGPRTEEKCQIQRGTELLIYFNFHTLNPPSPPPNISLPATNLFHGDQRRQEEVHGIFFRGDMAKCISICSPQCVAFHTWMSRFFLAKMTADAKVKQ